MSISIEEVARAIHKKVCGFSHASEPFDIQTELEKERWRSVAQVVTDIFSEESMFWRCPECDANAEVKVIR